MTSEAQILIVTPVSPLVADGCSRIAPCLQASPGAIADLDGGRLANIRVLVVSHVVVDDAVMDRLPALEFIANVGVGYDKIDVDAVTARGIAVAHTPGVLDDDVADLTVGLLLMTIRRLGEAERFVRAGRWANGAFALSQTLRGRRVGILGMGRIGRTVARRLNAFGVELAYCSRRPRPDLAYAYHADADSLARAVDVLICLLPGGDATRRMVDAKVLASLGADGVLINVGRGSSVDEAALADALRTGVIAAAGLDVFETEPLPDSPLTALENVVLLPHIGSATVQTRAAMAQLVVDNVAAWLAQGRALTPTPETAAANLGVKALRVAGTP